MGRGSTEGVDTGIQVDDEPDRVFGMFSWINGHIGLISSVLVVVGVGIGIVGSLIADTDEPNFSPSGEIYDTQARAEEVFTSSSSIEGATFIVDDADGQDVLSQAALFEYWTNSETARNDSANQAHLATVFDSDLGVEVSGVFSIADAADAALPSGLAGASDKDVKIVLSDLLADGAPTAALRFTLADSATSVQEEVGGESVTVWRSPAFLSTVRYDIGSFEGTDEQQLLD